jgi:hypothetical protein
MLRRTAPRRGVASDPSGRCLDAEMLAAWIDGDLTAADVSAAEAHVSSCARCQAMMAAIVRSTPPAVAPVPWWRRGWALGALVPLTAGAAAIAIYIATPNVERRAAPAVANEQALPDTVPSQAERRQLQPQVPPPAAPVQPFATKPQPPNANLEETRAFQAGASSSAYRAETRPAESEPAKKETVDGARRDEAARKSAPAPAVAMPAAAPPPATASLEAAASARLRDAAAAAAPAPQRETVGDRSVLAKTAFVRPPTEIISPDQSVRWRPGASGSIHRSTDGGATWTVQSSGAAEDLVAGSAPSSTACWIVGRRGTVLLTADGVQWRRIAFPETVDLVGVQAVDLAAATVTTADGRRFRTADGGQTWSRQ